MKILLLYSWNDLTSQHRYEILCANKDIAKFEIQQCFVLNGPNDKISKSKLKKKLHTNVKSFKPDVLLVHAGIAFHRYPVLLIDVLRELKNSFSELRIGIEEQPALIPYYSGYNLFETTTYMMQLQNLFFSSVFK